MVVLMDGHCKGSYMVKRAPDFLRAVLDQDGETDLLDLVKDIPKATEKIYVYKLVPDTRGIVHLDARGKDGKKITGWYAIGEYKHIPEIEGEQFRDNLKWQDWVRSQYGAK